MVRLILFWTLLFLFFHYGYGVGRWDVFSTKTLYDWALASRGSEAYPNAYMSMGVSRTICKAIQVNMVARHGARFPTLKTMKKIKALHKKITTSKASGKHPELDQWKFQYDFKMASELVTRGIREQFDIGKRTATRFYDLLSSYPENLLFVSSRKSRAKDSAKHFNEGMQDYISQIPKSGSMINDTTMRFYDGCYNHESQVDENVTHFKEFNDYSKRPEFTSIAENLKDKLGAPIFLTADEIYLIYELCAFEMYISKDKTWCSLLSDKERVILEYGQDLEKYYKSSYGHPINAQMACPLLRDMFDNMDKAANGSWNYQQTISHNGYLAGKFQFGHSNTVVPLMTALGLFKDDRVPLASNRLRMLNRLFRTSKIAPFSQNVAIVLYVCDNSRRLALQEFRPGQQSFRVRMFVNEKEVEFPTCSFMCSYQSIKKSYQQLLNNCDMQKVCGEAPPQARTMPRNEAIAGTKQISLTLILTTLAYLSHYNLFANV